MSVVAILIAVQVVVYVLHCTVMTKSWLAVLSIAEVHLAMSVVSDESQAQKWDKLKYANCDDVELLLNKVAENVAISVSQAPTLGVTSVHKVVPPYFIRTVTVIEPPPEQTRFNPHLTSSIQLVPRAFAGTVNVCAVTSLEVVNE